ncbi:MAG: type IV pilus modification PilV family protein [Pseudomonadota bacterium]
MNKADLRTVRPRGFSLLETLVAISILALTLGVMYQAQINGVHGLSHSFAVQRAVLHAESLLAEMGGSQSPKENQHGELPDGYRWALSISPIILPPAAQEGGPVTMLRVDLRIYWSERGREHQLSLQTLARS